MRTAKTLRVVRIFDPALDLDAMDMEAYGKTRDEKLVRVLPGKSPVWYTIRRIPRSLAFGFVRAVDGISLQRMRAFCAGVMQVENLLTVDGDRKPIFQPATKDQHGGRIVDDDELALFAEECIEEIGAVVSQFSFFHPEREVRFAVPPMSLAVLEGMRSLHAEQKAERALLSSDEAKAPLPESVTPTSVGSGVATTDATATESQTAL